MRVYPDDLDDRGPVYVRKKDLGVLARQWEKGQRVRVKDRIFDVDDDVKDDYGNGIKVGSEGIIIDTITRSHVHKIKIKFEGKEIWLDQDQWHKIDRLWRRVRVDDTNENGETALGCAAYSGSCKSVIELIKLNADVMMIDEYKSGYTPLYWAIKGNQIECVRILLDRKADVDVCGTNCNPLRALATLGKAGHVDIAQLLVDSRAQLDLPDSDDRTALWLAAFGGHADVLKLLLDANSDHTIKGRAHGQEYTPLEIATEVLEKKKKNSKHKDNPGAGHKSCIEAIRNCKASRVSRLFTLKLRAEIGLPQKEADEWIYKK